VFGGVTHQRVNAFDGLREVVDVVDAVAPAVDTGGLAVFVEHVDQVDVAGHVEFARTQLAHADNPQLGTFAAGCGRRAMAFVEFGERLHAGGIERELGQFGHGLRDGGQRGLGVAVQRDQPLQYQLPQHTQRGAGIGATGPQCGQCGRHGCAHRRAGSEQREVVRVAAAQPLHEPRVARERNAGGGTGRAV
jgi:hypothetical protein